MRFGAYGLDMSYIKSIRQHHTGGAIVTNNFGQTYRMIMDPATGWFDLVEITT